MDDDLYMLMFVFTFLMHVYDMDGCVIYLTMRWMMIYMVYDVFYIIMVMVCIDELCGCRMHVVLMIFVIQAELLVRRCDRILMLLVFDEFSFSFIEALYL